MQYQKPSVVLWCQMQIHSHIRWSKMGNGLVPDQQNLTIFDIYFAGPHDRQKFEIIIKKLSRTTKFCIGPKSFIKLAGPNIQQARKLNFFGTRPKWVVSYIDYTKFHLPRPVFHSPGQIFTRIGERASATPKSWIKEPTGIYVPTRQILKFDIRT